MTHSEFVQAVCYVRDISLVQQLVNLLSAYMTDLSAYYYFNAVFH